MSYRPRSPTVFLLLIFVAISSCEGNDELLPVNSTQNQEDSCTTSQCCSAAYFIDTRMNKNGDPCDDFYDYACGGYEQNVPISDDENKINPEVRAGMIVEARLRRLIVSITENEKVKPFRLIKIFYDTCIRGEGMESYHRANETLKKLIAESGGWPLLEGDKWNSKGFDKQNMLKYIFSIDDDENSTNVTNCVLGLSIKDPVIHRSYFRKGLQHEIFSSYFKYMVDFVISFDVNREYALFQQIETLIFEEALFTYVFPEKVESDWYRQYTRTTLDELEKKYPTLGFRKLFKRDDNPTIELPVDFESLDRLNALVSVWSDRALANWSVWRLASKYLENFPGLIGHESKTFRHVLEGQKVNKDRWRKCVSAVRRMFPLSLDTLYRQVFIDKKKIKDLTRMFDSMKQQFSRFVQKAEWLTESTKNQALNKIKMVNSNLYTCPKYMSYDELNVHYDDLGLADGSLQSNRTNISDFMKKVRGREVLHPMDKSSRANCERFMSPSDKFDLKENYFHFVAELDTDPWYDVNRPKYLNYGAIGSRMGHRISHTVDGHGKYFDVNGTLNLWWDSESLKKYDDKMECFVRHYGEFFALLGESYEVVFLNSSSTLKENVADNVGIRTAYYAYLDWVDKNGPEKKLPGLDHTPRQLFWISMANTHCTKYRSQYLRHLLNTGTRTPTKFRVNGPLSNMPEFAADFKCSSNSRMHPSQECRVW